MFDINNISRTGSLAGGSLWVYTTDDPVETIITDGYFDSFSKSLREGDIIDCSASDGVYPLFVESVIGESTITRAAHLDQLTNRKTIRRASDLSTINPSYEYYIDGELDLAGQSIEVPAGGLLLKGYGYEKSRLVCSEDNYDMFTSPVSGSGDIILQNVALEVTGTSSSIFAVTDSDGTHACEFDRVNFDNCTSLGYIDGYRQGLETDTGRFGGTPSLEFRGIWLGGYRHTTTIVRGIQSGTTIFKGAAGQTFGSRFQTNMNAIIPSGAVGLDFTDSNFVEDASFRVEGAFFDGAGTYIQNISESSRKSRISNSFGVRNTFVGGYWAITSTAGTGASSTPAKVAGTTTFDGSWFTEPGNNLITVATSQPLVVTAVFQGSFVGTAARQYTVFLRQWDASGSSYINHPGTSFTCNASGNAENVVLISPYIDASEDDRFEIWITDDSGTSTITAQIDTQFRVTEARS